ncbi:hypothetical protein ACYJW8_05350 [Frateuria aurantia]
MKSLRQQWFLMMGVMVLAGCGPSRPSVFPPQLSLDGLQVVAHERCLLDLRIKNDSYTAMTFHRLEGLLQVPGQIPLRISAAPEMEIPALGADVAHVQIQATPELLKALDDSRHGSAGLAYRLSGQVSASSDPAATPANYDFSHDDRLYPVPGEPQRYR